MIPKIELRPGTDQLVAHFIAELRLRGFEGDISTSFADRTVFATDNSIYQVAPQAILFPLNETDVVRIAKLSSEERFRTVTLSPRGGGTGTNGQALTNGVTVDLSRHMNSILEVNEVEGWARVQAGVVKDHLNAAVKHHELFFAPELSPSNRATIGGMIATDASGQGSVLYGKTRDHVLELTSVLMDGTVWKSGAMATEQVADVKNRPDRVGFIHRLLDRIRVEDAALIDETYPGLNRCVTGYDLVHLCDDCGNFNLNSVICGAEGSLALVTEAKIKLTRLPKYAALFNIRYKSFDAALRDAGPLMRLEAASSETVDSKVLALARQDPVWRVVHEFFPDDRDGPASGINIVELIGNTAEELRAKIERVSRSLDGDNNLLRIGYTIATEKADIKAVWSMRKKSVGLLGNMPGAARPIPFVEDTVVPPEHLADYISEFRALLDRRGLEYAMFGHVDAGCLHVRPAMDMKDPNQEVLVREITDEVFALTRKYKGVLWGEHGKGYRSEYSPAFFGRLYPRLQEIKEAFDPHNQLNPGKVATPSGLSLTRIDDVPTRGSLDRIIPIAVRQDNEDSLHCNGNAACFNYDPDDAMCPSWKATRERRHSPKGRASLMREWLTQLAVRGSDPSVVARQLRVESGFQKLLRWPSRAVNSWRARVEMTDFSLEVKEAMDGCLACKSCVGQCPIKVDVPSFRARFLEVFYGRYLRPAKHLLIANLEAMLPYLAKAPAISNWVTGTFIGKAVMSQLGLVCLPKLSGVNLQATLESKGVRVASVAALTNLSEPERFRSVVIVQDAFTSYYDTSLVIALSDLLQALGFTPWLAPYFPNGKPQHVIGKLGGFTRTARSQADALLAIADCGVSLVGIDPSMTMSFRSEYVQALGHNAVPHVALPQEWLAKRLDLLPSYSNEGENKVMNLLPHCTERTNSPEAVADWAQVCKHFGIDVVVQPSGCCGMAGLYGHEASNRATSETIYGLSWKNILADPIKSRGVVATGYSCRTQVKLMEGRRLQHPVETLLAIATRSSVC